MAAAPRACVRRLQRELAQVSAQGGVSPTVYIAPHSDDITTIDALIVGPEDTPYDGAMLHFRINVPPEYPLKPPHVHFMNTDGGTLRIHPQLYSDGKVCLSILGTWHGPKWTASQSLATVLLSIQSLLTKEPLRCEPGLENSPQDASDRANVFIVHEAARVLMIGALSGPPSWGQTEDVEPLTAAMHSHLQARRSVVLSRLAAMASKHDRQVLREPFVFSAPLASRRYDFAALAKRMAELLGGCDVPMTPSSSSTASASASGFVPAGLRRPERHEDRPEENDNESPQAHCRICHQTAEESSEPLITPCNCCGSIQYAHAKCILKWLEYSGQAALAKYRCDICRVKFRVRFGGGKSPGYAYLCRDVDVLEDPSFDAPGLVAAIFISLLQMLATTMGRMLAQSLHGVLGLICSPFPPWFGSCLLVGMQVPVLLLEAVTYSAYLLLLCAKAALLCWGPRWRPSDWGDFGEERVEYMLGAVADCLFMLGLRLDGVLLLASYFATAHAMTLLGGNSMLGLILRAAFGSEGGTPFAALEAGLKEPFPVLRSLLPEAAATLARCVHFPCGLASLSLNVLCVAGLLKRAFLQPRPVPVDILPAASASRGGQRPAALWRADEAEDDGWLDLRKEQ